MNRFIISLIVAAIPMFGQVYAVTMTAPGANYTSAPTVTATGGQCTTEPTMTATLTGQTVGSVTVTYAGICTLGGTPPSIGFSGGGGSGAAATAIMLQGNIAMLGSPLVVSDNNFQPATTGTTKLYRYECVLTVPALFVPFYSSANPGAVADRMPATAQSSTILWSTIQGASALQPLYATAFAAGVLTAYDGAIAVNSSTALATVQAAIVASCSQWQTALNAWNPWSNYGTYYNGTAWVTVTII